MSERLRVVVAGMVAGVPGQGGAVWAVLNWVFGFQALGHEVLLVEQVDGLTRQRRDYLDLVAAQTGLENAALVTPAAEAHGMTFADVERFCGSADLLVNLAGTLRIPELQGRPPRRAYVDLDPAFTQVWHDQGIDVGLDGHTHHFTVGLNVGGPGWTLPTNGIDWIPTLPPVALDLWAPSKTLAHDAWTTVGHWRGYGSAEHGGLFLGQRAHSWRDLFDLPHRTSQPLLPALAVHPDEEKDVAAFAEHGWRLLDPADVAQTPNDYRNFVRGSRGELCVAKQGYVVSNSGWFSDRSACYLAAGRPVVAQETGWSAHLPTGDGLWAYNTVEEVTAALEQAATPIKVAAVTAFFDEHLAAAQVADRLVGEAQRGHRAQCSSTARRS